MTTPAQPPPAQTPPGLPHLETARLWLRPYAPADVDALHALWTRPAVRRYIFDDDEVGRAFVEAEMAASMAAFAEVGYGQWVFLKKGEAEIIGFGGYRDFFDDPPELQLFYGLAPEAWGVGYATEAAQALIRYGFETVRFSQIVACTDPPNSASIRVIERLGFVFRDRSLRDGFDTISYHLARDAHRPPPGLYRLHWHSEPTDR